MRTILHIDGMSCGNCAKHVREALEGVPGVLEAEVDLEKKTASVEHGDDVKTAAFKTAVEEAGYELLS